MSIIAAFIKCGFVAVSSATNAGGFSSKLNMTASDVYLLNAVS
jgi:hypothetical protein